jgi:hypothetical protein
MEADPVSETFCFLVIYNSEQGQSHKPVILSLCSCSGSASVPVLCAPTDELLFISQAAPTCKEIVFWPTW